MVPRIMSTRRARAGALLTGCLVAFSPVASTVAAPPVAVPIVTAATSPITATSVPISGAAAPQSADDAVDKVLAISVDGLNPRAITALGPQKAPTFYRMMREGSYTFNARTEQELTITLPNHTGMLTGRRVDDSHGGHGVDFNTDTGSTVHKAAGEYVASVFDTVHDRGGKTALYSAKTKFALYQRTWNTYGRTDTVGKKNHGRTKIDKVVINTDNAKLVASLNAELKSKPRTFTFLHVSLPDAAGHAHGFMGKDYLAAVQQTDKLLGTLLNTIKGNSSLRKHMLVVLTADHGGNGASHSDKTSLQNYRIPFMAWGAGVPAGKDLYRMNPTYADPGTRRTSYSGKQPIRNGDLANLVTDVLDWAPVRGSQFNKAQKLDLFKR